MAKKTMMTVAGVTAGLSSILTATGAAAAPAQPQPEPKTIPYTVSDLTGDIGIQAVCQEASEYNNGSTHFYIPSITRNGGNLSCTLAQGNRTNGVFKLQDALRLCHLKSFVNSDGIFGPLTAEGLRQVTGSTVYSNFHAVNWPIYDANNNFTGVCANT